MELMAVDTPSDVSLSVLEHNILISLATGGTQGSTSRELGIPLSNITALLARKGVRAYLQELKTARREQMVATASEIAYEVLTDKYDKAKEEDVRAADMTRKDVIDVAKELTGILKQSSTMGAGDDTEQGNVFTNIYKQINILQKS